MEIVNSLTLMALHVDFETLHPGDCFMLAGNPNHMFLKINPLVLFIGNEYTFLFNSSLGLNNIYNAINLTTNQATVVGSITPVIPIDATLIIKGD